MNKKKFAKQQNRIEGKKKNERKKDEKKQKLDECE